MATCRDPWQTAVKASSPTQISVQKWISRPSPSCHLSPKLSNNQPLRILRYVLETPAFLWAPCRSAIPPYLAISTLLHRCCGFKIILQQSLAKAIELLSIKLLNPRSPLSLGRKITSHAMWCMTLVELFAAHKKLMVRCSISTKDLIGSWDACMI